MEDAAKILIVGGVLNLLYGIFSGLPIGIIRLRQPDYSKYLRLAHVGALMWGPLLLGLVFAVQLSDLSDSVEVLAAGLMIAASVLLNAKDTLNWLTGVQDEFAEQPQPATLMGGSSALCSMISIVIFTIGVFSGL